MSSQSPILRLPSELLREINDHLLSIKDLLRPRLVCRALGEAALKTQAMRFDSIYIDISRDSLQRFEDVCASPPHAAGIKHIIYIPPLMDIDATNEDHLAPMLQSQSGRKCPIPSFLEGVLEDIRVQQIEQQDLLSSSEIESRLLQCLPLLPALQQLYSSPKPWGSRWDHDSLLENTYSKRRSWSNHRGESSLEGHKDMTMGEVLSEQTLRCARFSLSVMDRPRLFAEPILLLKALAAAASTGRLSGLHLALWMPISFLGSACTSYLSIHPIIARDVFSWVTSMSLEVQPDRELDAIMRSDEPDRDSADTTAWVQLLRRLERLKELIVHCFEYESRTEDLVGFLHRHAKTLKKLSIHRASGIPPEDGVPKVESLRGLLDTIRTELTDIEKLSIVEVLCTRELIRERDLTSDEENHDPVPFEANRLEASTSDLGELAQEQGAIAGEFILTEQSDDQVPVQLARRNFCGYGQAPETTTGWRTILRLRLRIWTSDYESPESRGMSGATTITWCEAMRRKKLSHSRHSFDVLVGF
ncbi:hypothetical protein LTR78_000964 [Recurvomyces mirabilis]|uniref:F-box domain-containing protein n=1 Tax=Recurvomyces mirabilis TaxID=574656 RepID=A0AAE1C602_9PEZI|nr:hypothetical protein LTR78_000964 [Recurvomyces mirabilis]KAK5158936.1 hypothetical protein LTS14_003044 [Recurvomyces mirabilis]